MSLTEAERQEVKRILRKDPILLAEVKHRINVARRARLSSEGRHNRSLTYEERIERYGQEAVARADKRYRTRNRARRVAKTGVILIDWDNLRCTHCNRVSTKFTSVKYQHYDNCPQTPIEPVIPDWLERQEENSELLKSRS